MVVTDYERKVEYHRPTKTNAFTGHLAYHTTPKTQKCLIVFYTIPNQIGSDGSSKYWIRRISGYDRSQKKETCPNEKKRFSMVLNEISNTQGKVYTQMYIYLSVCLSIHLFIYPSFYLSIYLSIYLSTYLYLYTYLYLCTVFCRKVYPT